MNNIGNPAQDAILANDAHCARTARKASEAFLTALESGGPDRLVWRSTSFAGNQWGRELSATARAQRDSVERIMAEKDAMRDRVVSRDPCPRCGARGDFDCGHTPIRRLVAL